MIEWKALKLKALDHDISKQFFIKFKRIGHGLSAAVNANAVLRYNA